MKRTQKKCEGTGRKGGNQTASSHDADACGGNGTDYGAGMLFLCGYVGNKEL